MHFSGGPADPTHRLAAGWGTQLENTSELKVEAPFRLSCEGSYTLVSAFPPPFFPPPSPPPLWALHGVSSPSPLDSPLRRCRQGGDPSDSISTIDFSPFLPSWGTATREYFPEFAFSFLFPPGLQALDGFLWIWGTPLSFVFPRRDPPWLFPAGSLQGSLGVGCAILLPLWRPLGGISGHSSRGSPTLAPWECRIDLLCQGGQPAPPPALFFGSAPPSSWWYL